MSFNNTGLATSIYQKGDLAFKERKNPEKAKEALSDYEALLKANPKDPQANWRYSMACYFVGFRLAKTRAERLRLFSEGQRAGETALNALPNCAPCHFWTAVNTALYGQTAGVLKMLFTLGGIRDHLNETLRIDPSYANGGAYRILAKIDENLPGILGGDNERAKNYLDQAIKISPTPLNYLFLSQYYLEIVEDKAKALKSVHQGTMLPKPDPEYVEESEALEDLKKLEIDIDLKKSVTPPAN